MPTYTRHHEVIGGSAQAALNHRRSHRPSRLNHQKRDESAADSSTCFHGFSVVLSLAGGLHETARWRCGGYLGRTIDYGRVVNPSRQVRTFRDLFLVTELLDSKAESDDVGFGAELAWMSCQIERAFRFVEVLKKAAADPSNRSSIDPPLFRLSRSGSNSCCQSSLSIVS